MTEIELLSLYFQENQYKAQQLRQALGLVLDEFVEPRVQMSDAAGPGTGQASIENQQKLLFTSLEELLMGTAPLKLLLTGVAGAGKSFCLLKIWDQLIEQGLEALARGECPRLIPYRLDGLALNLDDIKNPVRMFRAFIEAANILPDQLPLNTYIQEKRLVVLVDNLHHYRKADLKQEYNRHFHWIISCRPGFEENVPENCWRMELQGFNLAERLQLLERCGLTEEKKTFFKTWGTRRQTEWLFRSPQLWRMALALDSDQKTANWDETQLFKAFTERTLAHHLKNKDDHERDFFQQMLPLLGMASLCDPAGVPQAKIQQWSRDWNKASSNNLGADVLDQLKAGLPRFYQPVKAGDHLVFVHGNLGVYLAAAFLDANYHEALPQMPAGEPFDSLFIHWSALRYQRNPDQATRALQERWSQFMQDHHPIQALLWLVRCTHPLLSVGLAELRQYLPKFARNRGELYAILRQRDPELIKSLTQKLDPKTAAAWRKGHSKSSRARKKDLKILKKNQAVKATNPEPPGEIQMQQIWAELQKTTDSRRRVTLINHIASRGKADEAGPLILLLTHQDKYTRNAAIRALGLLGNPLAIKHLIKRLKDPEPVNISEALTALGILQAEAAIPDLHQQTQAENPFIRAAAARSLGLLGKPESRSYLESLLDDPDRAVRGTAATASGLLGDVKAVDRLLDCLNPDFETDKAVRGAAATALGMLGDVKAVDPLLACLNPDREKGANVRGAAATALGMLGDVKAVDPLLACLNPDREKGANVRGAAAKALGMLGDVKAVDPLLACLNPDREKGANVRGAAAKALGMLGDVKAVDPLLACLNPDFETDKAVRGAAATALGMLGDVQAVDPLLACLNPDFETDKAVRGAAATALGMLGDVKAVDALLDCLNPDFETDKANRGAAATALGMLGDVKAVDPLLACLNPDFETDKANRGAAATALGMLGDVKAVDPLLACLNPDFETDKAVRGAAATALGMLGDVQAVDPLLACLNPDFETDKAVRGAAATALGMLGDVKAVDPLLAYLNPDTEKGANVRGAAATALGMLGDVKAVDPLLACLNPDKEKGADVRGSAATALGMLGDARAMDSLLKALNSRWETDSIVRGSAVMALGALALFGDMENHRASELKQELEAFLINEQDQICRKSAWMVITRLEWSRSPEVQPGDPITALFEKCRTLFLLRLNFQQETLIELLRFAVQELGQLHGRIQEKDQKRLEKYYEDHLHDLLALHCQVTRQPHIAKGQIPDLLVAYNQQKACIELKLLKPNDLDKNLTQLRTYRKLYPEHRGILLRLDQGRPALQGTDFFETSDQDELIWDLWVNRPNASGGYS